MYGKRGRIGLIVPSANTVMEPEFHKMAPLGVTTYATRMFIAETRVETLVKMVEDVERAARELSTAHVNVILFGCTAGSFLRGHEWDKQIVEKMEKEGKTPAITTSGSVIKALEQLEARKVAVATPYIDELNSRVKEFLERSGFEVTNVKGLGITKSIEIGEQYPESSYELAKHVYKPSTDTIFISCTDFRTIEIIERLERDLDVNVVTSNQASFWRALNAMKFSEPVEGYGKLLSMLG